MDIIYLPDKNTGKRMIHGNSFDLDKRISDVTERSSWKKESVSYGKSGSLDKYIGKRMIHENSVDLDICVSDVTERSSWRQKSFSYGKSGSLTTEGGRKSPGSCSVSEDQVSEQRSASTLEHTTTSGTSIVICEQEILERVLNEHSNSVVLLEESLRRRHGSLYVKPSLSKDYDRRETLKKIMEGGSPSHHTVHSATAAVTAQPSLTVSPVYVCRQSVAADVKDVLALEQIKTREVFGDVDVAECVEKRMCKSLFNKKKELVAFIVLQDHPNIPVISNCCSWTNWIRRYYRLRGATSRNTYFISYLVWDVRYPESCDHFLKSLYKNNVHLEFIMMVVPPGVSMYKVLEDTFTMILPNVDGHCGGSRYTTHNNQTLHMNLRLSVTNKLVVRKAGEEDNIDVQPLVAFQHPILKHVFGDFRLADVIDLKDSKKCTIVAEHRSGVTVGVMTLTTAVKYQHVSDFFYVPLHDFNRSDTVRSEASKMTIRHGTITTYGAMVEEELKSLTAGTLDEIVEDSESQDDEDEYLSTQEDRSTSEVLLDDEFRIVDPAMDYLLSKRKQEHDNTCVAAKGSFVSLDSSESLECGTYYGRPSWAVSSIAPVFTQNSCLGGPPKEPPVAPYTGPENGFQISLFALHPDLDHRYAYDILEAAFGCFPEKHYCLMALPTDYQGSPITKYFVRLTPRLSRDFPHELYIVHRNMIFSDFIVRPVSRVDYEQVEELVENLSQGRRIRQDLIKLLLGDSPGSLGYVMECEGNIVGFTIVSENFGLQQIRPHYRIDKVINMNRYDWLRHGLLRHCVVSTVFLRATSYFLTQILHQADFDTLSYCMLPSDQMSKMGMSLATVLGELTLVLPRHGIQYDLNALDIYTPEDFVVHQEKEFSLFVTTEKLLSVPKLELNYRVVVVGASDTALSFLENLIFRSAKKYIRYNNITLVSLHGLPYQLRAHRASDRMLSSSGMFTRNYLTRLSLQTHVNILYGIVTVLNRSEKMVCLNDEHWLRYDYLFLFTGSQYCKPMPGSVGGRGSTAGAEGGGCQKHHDIRDIYPKISREFGDNLLLVNTTSDCHIALASLRKIVAIRKTGKVLVYGNNLDIYTCISALLAFGVPGNKIVLIENADSCTLRGLDTNTVIEKVVVDSLQKLGVTFHHGFKLVNWNVRHKLIQKVMFCTDTNIPLTLDCLALFCFDNRATSAKTYLALTDSGIVYNDGIIINSQFRTNDEFIYAAGPGTKYSSRYQMNMADHAYFNSLEVGRHASKIFRRLVEPRPQDQEDSSKDLVDVPPVFKDAVTLVAQLPGNWNYFRLSQPGRPMPLECQLHGQGESGPVLITGDPIDPDGPGYFQLSLSVFGTVREITCLSTKEIPYHNLRKLYGKHERLLNNLLEQYNVGIITDLYAFFSQPWAYALYTSNFSELLHKCTEIFQADEGAGMFVMQDLLESHRVQDLLGVRISMEGQEEIARMYSTSSVPLYVQHLTLRYVSDWRLQLPMYLTDNTLASINRSYATSPLHRVPVKSKLKHVPKSSGEATEGERP